MCTILERAELARLYPGKSSVVERDGEFCYQFTNEDGSVIREITERDIGRKLKVLSSHQLFKEKNGSEDNSSFCDYIRLHHIQNEMYEHIICWLLEYIKSIRPDQTVENNAIPFVANVLTEKGAAALLGMSFAEFVALRKSGRAPKGVVQPNGRYMYKRSDIDKYIRMLRVEAMNPPRGRWYWQSEVFTDKRRPHVVRGNRSAFDSPYE